MARIVLNLNFLKLISNWRFLSFVDIKAQIENLRRTIMADPVQYEMIKQKFPELAKALQKNDAGKCEHW